jgi:hypothetical protein
MDYGTHQDSSTENDCGSLNFTNIFAMEASLFLPNYNGNRVSFVPSTDVFLKKCGGKDWLKTSQSAFGSVATGMVEGRPARTLP